MHLCVTVLSSLFQSLPIARPQLPCFERTRDSGSGSRRNEAGRAAADPDGHVRPTLQGWGG
eukprot:7073471-Alexandrium_andersonii.AAC.1